MKNDERRPADTETDAVRAGHWWGEFPVPAGTRGRWEVGPLTLWVERQERQWWLAWQRGDDPLLDTASVELPVAAERAVASEDAEQLRVSYERTEEPLRVLPLLPDRPIVARPETPFLIPPRQRVTVFVSSPLWVRLTGGPKSEKLTEIPSWRPSDTWFGTNRSGFLCYATRTGLRLRLEELPSRPQRAVTAITIDNRAREPLQLERLSLPVPNLSLFVAPNASLWTERLVLTREEADELARVRIDREAPPRPGATRLTEPREPSEGDLVSRVFTGLFG